MIEKTICLKTAQQIVSFYEAGQKLISDIDVVHSKNRRYHIDGKSLLGLMSLDISQPLCLIISGEDEQLAEQYFSSFEAK